MPSQPPSVSSLCLIKVYSAPELLKAQGVRAALNNNGIRLVYHLGGLSSALETVY